MQAMASSSWQAKRESLIVLLSFKNTCHFCKLFMQSIADTVMILIVRVEPKHASRDRLPHTNDSRFNDLQGRIRCS